MKNNNGFTLIELLVVIAIIGILSAVAVPQYSKIQAKARTGEVKYTFASMHTALAGFQAEYGGYAKCLPFMGFEPTQSEQENMYYMVGVILLNGDVSAPEDCKVDEELYFGGLKEFGGSAAGRKPTYTGDGCTKEAVGFCAAGAAKISNGEKIDEWSINEAKQIVHRKIGY